MRRLRSLAALLTAAGVVVTAQAPLPSAADLSARIQNRYAAVRDFTADFTLTLTSGLTRQTAQDRGKVSIKKPGRMRWVYETGSKMQLVADGTEVYTYFPKDRLVHVTPFPKDPQASSALLLLTGRGDLTRDFVPEGSVAASASDWRVTVKPKVRQTDFTSLTLVVDPNTLTLRGLVVNEEAGGIRNFTFSNLKENQELPDAAFGFSIPKGVEVQR